MQKTHNINKSDKKFQKAGKILDENGLCLLTKEELQKLSERYENELKNGLNNNKKLQTLPMLDTGLSSFDKKILPTSKESLVIEVGGTNIRAAWVKINQNHQPQINQKKDLLEVKLKKTEYFSPEDFFNCVVEKLKPVLGNTPPLAIGFIWSFPGQVIKKENGVDIKTKSEEVTHKFIIPGLKKPVGEYLLQALDNVYDSQNLSKIPLVVLNDTPAVLLSTGGKIGVIVATGFNIAINIAGKIINTESGEFSLKPDTYTMQVDKKSECPGKYLGEKQISGKWLGKTFTLIINDFIDQGLLNLNHGQPLTTAHMSKILKPAVDRYALGKDYGVIDTSSYATLSMIAERLTHRSAQIVGTMIGTIIKTFPKEFTDKKIVIPAEGSFFWKVPGYKKLVKKYAEEICGKKIVFPFINHPGILGAGAVVLSLIK